MRPQFKITPRLAQIYTAKQCTDLNDCNNAITEVWNLIGIAKQKGAPLTKLRMHLALLEKRKEDLK